LTNGPSVKNSSLKVAWALPHLKFCVHFSCPIESERFETRIAHKYVQFKPSDKENRVGQVIEYADRKARVTDHLAPLIGNLFILSYDLGM
jgi:hypothetical protein